MKFSDIFKHNNNLAELIDYDERYTDIKSIAEYVHILYLSFGIGDIDLSLLTRFPISNYDIKSDKEISEIADEMRFLKYLMEYFDGEPEVRETAEKEYKTLKNKLGMSLLIFLTYFEELFDEKKLDREFAEIVTCADVYLDNSQGINFYTLMGWTALFYLLRGDEKRCERFLNLI